MLIGKNCVVVCGSSLKRIGDLVPLDENTPLICSVPYISPFRRVRRKKDVIKIYPEEMINLLNIDVNHMRVNILSEINQ